MLMEGTSMDENTFSNQNNNTSGFNDNPTGPMNFDEQSYSSQPEQVQQKKSWSNAGTPQSYSNNTGKVSNLSKWSLALSLLGCTTFIGGILAIVDLTYKDGRKKVVSIISLCICGFVLVLLVAGRINSSLDRKHMMDNVETSSSIPGDDSVQTEAVSETTTEVTTEATTMTTTEATTEEDTEATTSSGMRTDFKDTLDAYEEFMDEYIEFMELYNQNPTDAELMSQYMDMMTKYTNYATTISKMDQSEMTDEEAAYFVEVTGRVNQKLINASLSN